MVQRLKELSEQSQRALKLAACLGLQFDLAMLARICAVGPEMAHAWLGTALQSGVLQALGADGLAVAATTPEPRTCIIVDWTNHLQRNFQISPCHTLYKRP